MGNVVPVFRDGEVVFNTELGDGSLLNSSNIIDLINGGVELVDEYEKLIELGDKPGAETFNKKNNRKPKKIFDLMIMLPTEKLTVRVGENKTLNINRKQNLLPVNHIASNIVMSEARIVGMGFIHPIYILMKGKINNRQSNIKLNYGEEYQDIFFEYAKQSTKFDIRFNILRSNRSPKEGELLTINESTLMNEQDGFIFDPDAV